MKGCISAHTLRVYRLYRLRIFSWSMSGLVCVLGGRFLMSLIIFF